MIDAYVGELARRLPKLGRRRFLAETEAHLRDAAARHEAAGCGAETAEERAVREFGPAELVAARFAEELSRRTERLARRLTLLAAALFVVPLYGIPESTLPPAPWPAVPGGLAWQRDLGVALWAGALVLATVGLLTRRTGVVIAALGCLGASAVQGAALAVQWNGRVPATPLAELLALTLALAVTAVVVPAAGFVYARRLAARAGARSL